MEFLMYVKKVLFNKNNCKKKVMWCIVLESLVILQCCIEWFYNIVYDFILNE